MSGMVAIPQPLDVSVPFVTPGSRAVSGAFSEYVRMCT